MIVFKRFSGLGKSADGSVLIEKRDCLYAPYARKGSSYLSKKDALGPCYDFREKLPEDKSQLRISEINLNDENPKVKKLTNRM